MAGEGRPLRPMKTLIQIAVVLTVLTATVQGARAAIKHYAFVDALHESMLFVSSQTEEQLADRVMRIAEEHEIPLDPSHVTVRREPYMVIVDAPYTDVIDLLPGVYSRTWDFDTRVNVRQLEDTRPRGPSQPGRRR